MLTVTSKTMWIEDENHSYMISSFTVYDDIGEREGKEYSSVPIHHKSPKGRKVTNYVEAADIPDFIAWLKDKQFKKLVVRLFDFKYDFELDRFDRCTHYILHDTKTKVVENKGFWEVKIERHMESYTVWEDVL